MSAGEVTVETNESVSTITLNRPDSLNAFTLEMVAELRRALEDSERSPDVTVVVIRGAGEKAFCTGADIKVFEEFADPENARRFWRFTGPQVHSFIESMTKPVIAVVTGYCLGGGLEIALACDFVVATEDSKFGFPEINLGLIPGWGGTQRIARVIGRMKAKELVMLGGSIDASEAFRLGLVSKVVPRSAVQQTVNGLVATLKGKGAIALAYAKEAVNRAYEMDLASGLAHETELDSVLIRTEDVKEGVRAFLEKRKPNFKGK